MSPYAFVVTWIVQAAVLGVVALLLARLFRLRQPMLLESWWQSGAFAVVLLPVLPLLLPPRTAPVPLASFVESTTVALSAAPAASRLLSPLTWLALLWVCGALGRLAWLAAGQRRLRRLASKGELIEDDPALARARALAHAQQSPMPLRDPVSVIATDDVGPCAFGWVQVQVLVPRALRDLPEPQRLAVYLHELLHAVRFDVQRSYADEVWRLIWWWQPAVWWMLARLRLARELQVDRTVVAATGQRRAYVEALLWCGTRRPTLALSAQVGGGRHELVRRVALLCEEVEMSRMRRWGLMAGLGLAFIAVGSVIELVSPLRAAQGDGWSAAGSAGPGPLEQIAARPTLDAPAPRRIVAVEPEWADTGSGYRFRTHVVLDAAGHVAEARLVGAPATSTLPTDLLPALQSARVAAIEAVRQWQFEPPVHAPMLIVTDVTVGGGVGFSDLLERTDASLGTLATASRRPLRVGGNIRPPSKVLDVKPEYPQVALDADVSGVVILETTIGPDGVVREAKILRSIPLLDQAAIAAVRQWRYTPTLVNGVAVPVVMVITVNFTLSH